MSASKKRLERTEQNRGVKRRRRRWRDLLLAMTFAACLAGAFVGGWEAKTKNLESNGTALAASLSSIGDDTGMGKSLTQETVDVFGGSMAHGWLDPKDDSYLKRAFTTRSDSTDVTYDYVDHTVVGQTPVLLATQKPNQFKDYMQRDKPDVVVLSWGLLNSMSSRHKTTITAFGNAIHQEIADALAVHAVVLIVTPPVTQLSATTDAQKQEQFLTKLNQEAKSFNSINVVVIDVYHQMADYLTAHDQTYEDYYGNSWHPNEAGHELAGMLLSNDLMERYHYGPIVWKKAR